MTAIQYLLDEHVDHALRDGLSRRWPDVVVWAIGDPAAPERGTLDPEAGDVPQLGRGDEHLRRVRLAARDHGDAALQVLDYFGDRCAWSTWPKAQLQAGLS